MTNDLAEEIQARKETEAWHLKPCNCCGGKAIVLEMKTNVRIDCGRYGCQSVSAPSVADAARIWNQKDFRSARP